MHLELVIVLESLRCIREAIHMHSPTLPQVVYVEHGAQVKKLIICTAKKRNFGKKVKKKKKKAKGSCNVVSHKKSLVSSAICIWNAIPENISALGKWASFKKGFDRHLGMHQLNRTVIGGYLLMAWLVFDVNPNLFGVGAEKVWGKNSLSKKKGRWKKMCVPLVC